MLKSVNPVLYGKCSIILGCYTSIDIPVELVEAVVQELRNQLSVSRDEMTEDHGWSAINTVLQDRRVKSRVELLTPMRHALTGRRVSSFTSTRRRDCKADQTRMDLVYLL